MRISEQNSTRYNYVIPQHVLTATTATGVEYGVYL